MKLRSGPLPSHLATKAILNAAKCVIKNKQKALVADVLFSDTDPDVDDDRRHHDAYALQQVSHHVDEGGADAGVAMGATAKECMGVAMYGSVALAILVNLVIAAAMSVEGGGVMEDVRHATRGKEKLNCRN